MFPIDFGFNTLKVKITVPFKVNSKCVNIVRSITSLVRPTLFKFDKDVLHNEMFPFDARVYEVKIKVTVTFNIDCQYVKLIRLITRIRPSFFIFQINILYGHCNSGLSDKVHKCQTRDLTNA